MPSTAMLVLIEGPGAEPPSRWALKSGATTVGRAEDNDIVLQDREVSRRHARILHDGDSYVLVDLGSTNGTLLNGVRINRAVTLRSGDDITIAPRFRFQFVDSEATVPSRVATPGLEVDTVTRTVTISGQQMTPPLARIQYTLLELLASEPRRVFGRREIAAACYPDATEEGVSDQAIDGVVRRLRARLAAYDSETAYIVAVRGHGYRLLG